MYRAKNTWRDTLPVSLSRDPHTPKEKKRKKPDGNRVSETIRCHLSARLADDAVGSLHLQFANAVVVSEMPQSFCCAYHQPDYPCVFLSSLTKAVALLCLNGSFESSLCYLSHLLPRSRRMWCVLGAVGSHLPLNVPNTNTLTHAEATQTHPSVTLSMNNQRITSVTNGALLRRGKLLESGYFRVRRVPVALGGKLSPTLANYVSLGMDNCECRSAYQIFNVSNCRLVMTVAVIVVMARTSLLVWRRRRNIPLALSDLLCRHPGSLANALAPVACPDSLLPATRCPHQAPPAIFPQDKSPRHPTCCSDMLTYARNYTAVRAG